MTVKGFSPALFRPFSDSSLLTSTVLGLAQIVSDVDNPSDLAVNLNFLPNMVWLSDITEIKTDSGPCYLCVVLDLFARRIVAARIAFPKDAELVCRTFKDAFIARGSPKDLEPIPKLLINGDELTPDNNTAGKLNQSHVVGGFLFIANQKFAETVEKRVRHLKNPAACMKVGVAFRLLLFLAAGPDMWNIIALFNRLTAASIACVQAQILRMYLIRLRTQHYDMIEHFFQQFDIMRICSRKNNCQWK